MPESLYLVTIPDTRLGRHVVLRVREISDSALGVMFVRLAGFVFDAAGPIVNPVLEAERERFADTRVLHVNRMSIISIEEVSDASAPQLTDTPENVLTFKTPE